jgi:hypothetical protein
MAGISDLDVLGIEPEVGVSALEHTGAEGLHLLILRPMKCRDAIIGHPSPASTSLTTALTVMLWYSSVDLLVNGRV